MIQDPFPPATRTSSPWKTGLRPDSREHNRGHADRNPPKERPMANQYRRFAAMPLVAALLASGHAQAQQLPSLDSAIATATRWAAQADAGQADAMWKSSGPMMQK